MSRPIETLAGSASGVASEQLDAISVPVARLAGSAAPRRSAWSATWRPVWSVPAGFRALRATLVVPALFAVTSRVVGNPQMATFAGFGGFATLVLAGFTGSRRDLLIAHGGLAVVGSVLLIIGTAVTSTTALAVAVTVPVTLVVLFAGILGPNAAAGATAVMLAYVLPAASPGTMSMLPSRLLGWWLASIAGTIAVLVLRPRPASDRLKGAAAALATGLADLLDFDADLVGDVEPAALGEVGAGVAAGARVTAVMEAREALLAAVAASPAAPTGVGTADQALANLVEALDWAASLAVELVTEAADLTAAAPIDLELLAAASGVLRDLAAILRGDDARPAIDHLEELREASSRAVAGLQPGTAPGAPEVEAAVHFSFHARIIGSAVRSAAADVLIVAGTVDTATIAAERFRWQGGSAADPAASRPDGFLQRVVRKVGGNASLRSVWLLNSVRGAVALALAVAVADLTNVQHGFWVVLGALSVLRTSAAATGSTALRALAGAAIGFAVGGVLILAVGTGTTGLWVALPIAVLIAAYAPGTAPFVVGQAAFTLTIIVLYNITVPVGWEVGVVRIEDVAIGAAVSVVVGAMFWPRGATAVVARDLADAFRRGGSYLVEATQWAVGTRLTPPAAGTGAAIAGLRLDDAVRGMLAEQGTKRVATEDVRRLVSGALRLRLTAQSLSGVPRPSGPLDPGRLALVEEAMQVAGSCDSVAARIERIAGAQPPDLAVGSNRMVHEGYLLWVRNHLDHVRGHLGQLVDDVERIALAHPGSQRD